MHRAVKTLVALLAAPALAVAIGALLIALLPTSPEIAFAIGSGAVIPLWVTLSCALPLVRGGKRAWAFAAVTLLPILVALALRRSP